MNAKLWLLVFGGAGALLILAQERCRGTIGEGGECDGFSQFAYTEGGWLAAGLVIVGVVGAIILSEAQRKTQRRSDWDPGWYAVPNQPGLWRWWDGRGWTPHLSDGERKWSDEPPSPPGSS